MGGKATVDMYFIFNLHYKSDPHGFAMYWVFISLLKYYVLR